MKSLLLPFTRLSLLFTFLVIIAGSVVRVSESGMGCPDWPRCFGYYIPPTDPSQVDYHPGQAYSKGMMVIVNDTLWRATTSFTAAPAFDRAVWEKYPKHDYAHFVVYQTWVEYINRLLGALMGLWVLGAFVASLFWWREDKVLVLGALSLLFLTGFQAWLGKLVVDGNLIPQSISIHMLAALVLVFVAQWMLFRIRGHAQTEQIPRSLRWLAAGAAFMALLQILIGTQVREEIDAIAKALGSDLRGSWIDELSGIFSLHKSFSLMLGAVVFLLVLQTRRSMLQGPYRKARIALMLVAAELVLGLSMQFFGMPHVAQTLHLLCATLLIAALTAVALHPLKVSNG